MATIFTFGPIPFAFVLTFGLVFISSFLQILQVAQTIMADASLYLRLILIGFPSTFIQISFRVFFVYLLVPALVLQVLLLLQQLVGSYASLSILLLRENTEKICASFIKLYM